MKKIIVNIVTRNNNCSVSIEDIGNISEIIVKYIRKGGRAKIINNFINFLYLLLLYSPEISKMRLGTKDINEIINIKCNKDTNILNIITTNSELIMSNIIILFEKTDKQNNNAQTLNMFKKKCFLLIAPL